VADAEYGNVYFLDCPQGTVKNGPCTIPAKSALEWQFTETGGHAEGNINYVTGISTEQKKLSRYGWRPPQYHCAFLRDDQQSDKWTASLNSPSALDVRFVDR
jgi:hypothetical protein